MMSIIVDLLPPQRGFLTRPPLTLRCSGQSKEENEESRRIFIPLGKGLSEEGIV
jgi:hypothetical protein